MKTIVFNKKSNYGLVYAFDMRVQEYECDNLSKNSDIEILLTNEDIDQFITMLTELKEK